MQSGPSDHGGHADKAETTVSSADARPHPGHAKVAAANDSSTATNGDASINHEMEGFAFDESSGLFYNSSLGYYFDPGSQLYGDAASGHWWKYHNGQYQLVS